MISACGTCCRVELAKAFHMSMLTAATPARWTSVNVGQNASSDSLLFPSPNQTTFTPSADRRLTTVR